MLNFTFHIEHVTELIELEEIMSLIAYHKLGNVGKINKMNNVALQQKTIVQQVITSFYSGIAIFDHFPQILFQHFPMEFLPL